MGKEQSPIGLKLPVRNKPGRDAFDTRGKQVEEWVQALPLANVGETARRIYNALREVNRLQIHPADRFEFLEQLRQPLFDITDTLRRHFVGRSFPLATKSLRIAALTRELHNEMALGYKIIASELAGKSVLFRKRKLLAAALQRAIYHLGRVQLTAYQIYATPPAQTWQDIHKLFACAETLRLHRKRISDQHGGTDIKISVEERYKHTLLLALASPYRLRQGEVQIVDRLLNAWTGSTRLYKAQQELPPGVLFLVRLDCDEEPVYSDEAHRDCSDTQCRLLDAEPAVELARSQLEQKRAGKTNALQKQLGPGLSEDLLQRLINMWGSPVKRGDERAQEEGMVTVALGLLMLHNSLLESARDSSAAEKFADRASFTGRDASAELQKERSRRDVWDVLATPAQSQHRPAPPKAGAAMPSAPAMPQLWQVCNLSNSGYCLRREGTQAGGVHVGELVGVRRDDEPWEIATVRWIKHPTEETVELGVQVLGRAATAVALSRGGRHDEQYQRGLLLPPTGAAPESLIVPAMLFEQHEILTLHGAGAPWRLRLGKSLETGGSFARLEFEPLDTPAGDTTPAAAAESGEFGNLWSQL